MGGLAQIAKAAGHRVSGCDANVYPPMSDQLREAGIDLIEGFGPEQLSLAPDLWVIGNAISRGNPLLEAVLNAGLPYTSGPQWLAENVLVNKKVIAVAGTHGKTTTTSLATWILDRCGLNPGYLVGGVPQNFHRSARLTDSPWFVIEADEYDTAFFDKRSKFVHYRPRIAILNNLEYDHADIFPDLAAIERQFHHLVRTVPSNGRLIVNGHSEALARVLEKGCWTPAEYFSAGGVPNAWSVDGDREVRSPDGELLGRLQLKLFGQHNALNALAAVLAAHAAGVSLPAALDALETFCGVARRLELKGVEKGVSVVDDFAHHPTAIIETLRALRSAKPEGRILAVFEPRSNTMKMGSMKARLPEAFALADRLYCYQGAAVHWDVAEAMKPIEAKTEVFRDIPLLVDSVVREARAQDTVLVMSNGGFGGIQQLLLRALKERP
jgi:UDP-N-acetylmuramate: L-alanyl-gamma-D-glutamyl-meso-diaminopimelate ligase